MEKLAAVDMKYCSWSAGIEDDGLDNRDNIKKMSHKEKEGQEEQEKSRVEGMKTTMEKRR